MKKEMLDPHQAKACRRALSSQSMAVWWRPGLGKTRVALAVFASLAKTNDSPTFIYVCRRAAFNDVYEELDKIEFRCNVWEYSSGAFPVFKDERPTIILVSNGLLARNIKHISSLPFIIQAVAFDEGFLFKNPKAAITKAANKLSSLAQMRLILSGSIMTARNIEDVYGQMFAINQHTKLARTLTDFRSLYMVAYTIQMGDREIPRFATKKGAFATIAKRLAPYISVRFPKHERIVRKIVKRVPIHPLQKKLIQRLAKEYYCEYNGIEVECKSALALTIKAQQISNGYLQDEKGNCVSVPSNKIEAIKGFVQELYDAGERCVIWVAFRHDLEILKAALPMEIATVASGVNRRALAAASDQRVVAVTEAFGSSFNVLAQFPYACYFSMSHKWLDLQQSMHRTLRKNSQHPTAFFYFWLVKESLDGMVYKAAHDSKKTEKELINRMRIKKWLSTNAAV